MTCTLILFAFAGLLFALNANLKATATRTTERVSRWESAQYIGRYAIHPSELGPGWVVRRTDTDFPVKWCRTEPAARQFAEDNPNPTLLLLKDR